MFPLSELLVYSSIVIAHLGVTTFAVLRVVRIVARQRALERIYRERFARARAAETA